MTKNLIRVYEHESLKVNQKGFTETHLNLLSKYLGDKDSEAFPYYSLINNGVKFKQYVGVISVGNLQIEVLPKADKILIDGKDEEEIKNSWESHLLEMLRAVYKLKVTFPSNADQKTKQSSVLDVLLNHFMDEVEYIMHIGLVKAYRRVEDNCNALKGRLVLSKHIVKNIVHKERFYVEYTTYDRNHILNCLLYKALKVIPDISANSYTIHRSKTLMFEFPELNDIVVTESVFNRIDYDRKTDDYRDAIDLAGMILLNYMPNLSHRSGNNVIALMFDMNKLWEEYVYIVLKRQLPDYSILAQKGKRFWYSETVGGKDVKPDIVIKKDKKCIAVLDTKWKCPSDGKPSDSDLKQMYVYHKYWVTNHTALVYPGNKKPVEGSFTDDADAKCSMYFLPIINKDRSRLLETKGIVSMIKSI